MVKVPEKKDVISSGKVAVGAATGGLITGLAANILGGPLGVLVGSILGGSVVGGDVGRMITVNGVQDSVQALMMGGMGEVGEGSGGSVM